MSRGRKAQVRYWKSRGGYYTTYGGRQHKLAEGPDDAPCGPVFLLALDKYKELMSLEAAEKAGDRNPVRVVLEHFLQAQEAEAKPATFRIRRQALRAFCASGLADTA